MAVIKGTIEIDCPVEEVFAYLAEPKNALEWESGLEVNELTSEGPIGVGSKGRRVDNYLGRDDQVMEVTEWMPNQLAAFKFESDGFISYLKWRTEPADGGTRFAYQFNTSPKNPIFKLLMPLMILIVKPKVKKKYRKLKEVLESRS